MELPSKPNGSGAVPHSRDLQAHNDRDSKASASSRVWSSAMAFWYRPSMTRYDLSQRSKDVISERHIRLAWLEQVLDSPELREADRDDRELMHHVGRIKEYGNRALRVVFKKSVSPVRIVTVYFDRKMKGKL
jgi:hypothetical protein